MKIKQWREFKNLTEGELLREYETKTKKFFELKVQNRFSPVKNPLEIRELRRDLARIKTLFKSRFNKKI